MKSKILVVGGGITGLVAAYRLLQKKYQVTLVEKNESLGGLLGSFKINNTYLEKTYHHIFKTDKEINYYGIHRKRTLNNKFIFFDNIYFILSYRVSTRRIIFHFKIFRCYYFTNIEIFH